MALLKIKMMCRGVEPIMARTRAGEPTQTTGETASFFAIRGEDGKANEEWAARIPAAGLDLTVDVKEAMGRFKQGALYHVSIDEELEES